MPITLVYRLTLILTCVFLLANCSFYEQYKFNQQFGYAQLIDRQLIAEQQVSYWSDVQPVLEKRCVVCHGCYDAPCQLKLSAFEGVERGASKEKVYVKARLLSTNLTRLFEDGNTLEDWRNKSFYPVLNERVKKGQLKASSEANTQASTLYQILALKKENPLTTNNQILSNNFEFTLGRKESCPKIEEFHGFAKKYPEWGMPYALPGLNEQEHSILTNWIKEGSPYREKQWISSQDKQHINEWELFFNGHSLKQQLSSRYLYEHLFLSHIYFEENGRQQFYRLVRSRTPSPNPAQQIATRRPYGSPFESSNNSNEKNSENTAFYYRLLPVKTSILNKNHMPYLLNEERKQKWQKWFIQADYTVTTLPSYDIEIASNPFIAFKELPQHSRHQFLLDEAQHTIMGFIKGPVCRGKIALGVIEDHFWVVFTKPNNWPANHTQNFLVSQSDLLQLPAEKESNALALKNWLLFSKQQKQFLEKKTAYINEHKQYISSSGLDFIWDGNKDNDNYALTIMRHQDSATVVKGFVGQTPKTAWLIDYSLLERIHYLLVAGFDVYGNTGHQLNTRLYMDFLRMEGEFNFLAFMPQDKRETLRDYWYREASQETKEFVYGTRAHFDKNTGIQFNSDNPMQEFFQLLQARSRHNTNQHFNLDRAKIPHSLRRALDKLNTLQGAQYNLLPNTAFIQVNDQEQKYYFTLIKHIGHFNVSHLLPKDKMLAPKETYLSLVPGLLGAYPNRFFSFDINNSDDFVRAIASLSDNASYTTLGDQFAIRRSATNFWAFSDELHNARTQQSTAETGLFDYNRLENR